MLHKIAAEAERFRNDSSRLPAARSFYVARDPEQIVSGHGAPEAEPSSVALNCVKRLPFGAFSAVAALISSLTCRNRRPSRRCHSSLRSVKGSAKGGHDMGPKTKRAVAAFMFAALLGVSFAARAETDRIRIAQQFGISYLPLIVASERGLVEQEARAIGIAPPKIEWLRLSGAASMNEALISGSLDFATAGVAPMILTWDKTRSTAKIIGVASLGSMANVLTTNNLAVKTIADFTEKDRIALPSVKVGFQPIVLQMAADQAFGKYDKLDELTVSMPHPDATAAILSGRSEITAHFTAPPFSQQQLASGKVREVLNSYDVLGGPHTFNVVYSTAKFVQDNPKTIDAFVRGLDAANAWIKANPAEAAALYIKAENSKLAPDFIEAIIRDKNVNFTTTPENVKKFADFELKLGLIKQSPASWADLFQPGLSGKPGS
jgi:NitT/TauT family transport system substrate-binding protein